LLWGRHRSVTQLCCRHLCSARGFELRVPLPDVVAMQTRQPNLEGAGEIPLRRLVKEALRMRPSRIVVGEVRQEECLDLTTQSTRSTTGPRVRIRLPTAIGDMPRRIDAAS
jgi:hypothetical protein